MLMEIKVKTKTKDAKANKVVEEEIVYAINVNNISYIQFYEDRIYITFADEQNDIIIRKEPVTYSKDRTRTTENYDEIVKKLKALTSDPNEVTMAYPTKPESLKLDLG